MIKSDIKINFILQKKMLTFLLLKESWKYITIYTKILISIFRIDKMFIERQIGILEWFLSYDYYISIFLFNILK